MSNDQTFMQHLQQMLSGTVPMAGQGGPGQSIGTPQPQGSAPLGQMPPLAQKPDGGVFAGTSPLAPPSVNADPAPAVGQLMQPQVGSPKTFGGPAGTSPLQLGGTERPGGAGGNAGTFDIRSLLRNTQAAMPRGGMGVGEESRSLY